MKLLIDTQVFVWLTNEDPRLGASASKLLSDLSNQVYISYFSFFEMAIKASIGKLNYDSSVIDDLPKMGIELVMPNEDVLKDYRVFDSTNKDPFDNMLIAVVIDEKCTFVTSDRKILALSVSELKLLDASK